MANTYNLYAAYSIKELLLLKPDWVYIGTPLISHLPLSEMAIQARLNILCEKPLAHDGNDAFIMTQAAEKCNIQTAMHFPLMYSAPVRHMLELVEKGIIGEIVRIELSTYFPHWPRLWQQNRWIGSREQGGFIREVFPHYFQLMYRMFGNVSLHDHKTTYPER